MKYVVLFLSVLAFATSQISIARGEDENIVEDTDLPATKIDPKCILDPKDPYDLGWRLTEFSRENANLCLKTIKNRPAKIVKDTRAEMQIANFFHKGKFWIATWNKRTNRPKAQFFAVHFSSGFLRAGHTELRFIFPESIELKAQVGDESDKVKEVVVSWEGIYPEGVGYTVMKGMTPNFGFAGRVMSMENRMEENAMPGGKTRQTDVYDLKMSEMESAFLFQESIHQSDRLAFKKFYETIRRNCTTQVFESIDAVLRTVAPERLEGLIAYHTPVNSVDPIVGESLKALIDRKLIKSREDKRDLGEMLGVPSVYFRR